MINGAVCDLLCQSNPDFVKFPELVDLAVVATGLGMPRNNLSFVSKQGVFWDSTQWGVPRQFLDCHSLAYVNAIASWARGDAAPNWANHVDSELKRPLKGSLKFLMKTSDTFFQPSKPSVLSGSSHADWWKRAADHSTSNQIVALRQLQPESPDGQLTGEEESLCVTKLRSNVPAITLNAIAAIERLQANSLRIADELRELVNDRDEQIRSKAMCTLARLEQLDSNSIDLAADMLESSVKHNVFAGIFALGSLSRVPEHVMEPVNRGFKRALKACDYEFVGLYIAGYDKWMNESQSYIQELLQDDSPEYLQIAMEVIEGKRQQLVGLS